MSVASVAIDGSDNLSLAGKARVFGVDIAERFVADGGQVRTRRRLPTAEHPYVTHNMPDNAYMTGIYCAAETWRHLATGDPEAASHARAACAALGHLAGVSGRRGLLARASVPIDEPWFDDGVWRESPDGRYRWRGNVSSDQVDGLMFGIFVYATHLADDDERVELARAVAQIVDAIIGNDFRIIGYDGDPTEWGHYELSYVTEQEPMNALLMLQMVKVARALTGDARYDREYQRLLSIGVRPGRRGGARRSPVDRGEPFRRRLDRACALPVARARARPGDPRALSAGGAPMVPWSDPSWNRRRGESLCHVSPPALDRRARV